jgi:hypothetical protein
MIAEALYLTKIYAAVLVFAKRLFLRAAAFLWMSPLRAARSNSVTAVACVSADAPGARAFFNAVRRAER